MAACWIRSNDDQDGWENASLGTHNGMSGVAATGGGKAGEWVGVGLG